MKATIIKTSAEHFFEESHFVEEEAPDVVLTLHPERTYQSIQGFGGALTEAAAHVFDSMDPSLQKQALDLYFSAEGCRYNWLRLSINSCDFSLGKYEYAREDDLSDFSLAHDLAEIVPLYQRAEAYRPLKVIASTWSPLAQWKDNGTREKGGHLKEDCYEKQAGFVDKYIKAMRNCGVNVVAITPQNEPNAKQVWDSCLYDAAHEAKLIKALKKAIPEDVAIYAWDHNRDELVARAKSLFADPEVFVDVTGIAYHWYDLDRNAELGVYKALYPNKGLIFTEGCVELFSKKPEEYTKQKGSMESGLRYAKNYIKDLGYGSEAFIDWNLFLDLKGGPNWVGNFCEAPIMSDGKTLRISSSYYAIKHFAHFIEPGAIRLGLDNPSNLLAVALRNPNGDLVVELLNLEEKKSVSLQIESTRLSCYLNHDEIATIVVKR